MLNNIEIQQIINTLLKSIIFPFKIRVNGKLKIEYRIEFN